MHSWLTNDIRPDLGLQLLDVDWKAVELRSGYWILLDGDIIRKVIGSYDQSYSENDVYIATRDQQWILPLTAKGKEKKLNFSNLTAACKGKGIHFTAGFQSSIQKPYVTVRNHQNTVTLPIKGYEACKTKEDLICWLQQFPSQLPSDYDIKLNRLHHMKKKRYTAVPGDIFRIELDLFTDTYVLVIGDLRKMQKDNLFPEQSLWHSVMTMPLFVRPYLYQTRKRSPELSEITASPLADLTQIVMDDHFLRGAYEWVGYKCLEETDIEFPIGYGLSTQWTETEEDKIYSLSWGTGTAHKPKTEVKFTASRTYSNNGVYAGVSIPNIESPENDIPPKSLNHPLYADAKAKALAEFNFPADISYDEFNIQTGGLTRRQYLDYLSQTYTRYQK